MPNTKAKWTFWPLRNEVPSTLQQSPLRYNRPLLISQSTCNRNKNNNEQERRETRAGPSCFWDKGDPKVDKTTETKTKTCAHMSCNTPNPIPRPSSLPLHTAADNLTKETRKKGKCCCWLGNWHKRCKTQWRAILTSHTGNETHDHPSTQQRHINTSAIYAATTATQNIQL